MKYKIVEKESFQVVGVKRTYNCQKSEHTQGIPVFWDDVHADGTNDLLFELNNGVIEGALGVCVADEAYKENYLIDYWIATAHIGDVPENLLAMELLASKWAIFEVNGPMPVAIQNTWKQIYSEWFPSNSYEHAGTPDLEVYSNEDPSSSDYYSEIWIPIK